MAAAALPALLLAATACDREPAPGAGEYSPLITFDNATARIVTAADTFTLAVEIAERDDQRSYGLMERSALPEESGMVFLYGSEQPEDAGFWMFRTRIPLDIAFLDEDGTILRILPMDPCPSADPRGCRAYPPGVAYYSALEVNRGYFARRGIGVGDRVLLDRSGAAAD